MCSQTLGRMQRVPNADKVFVAAEGSSLLVVLVDKSNDPLPVAGAPDH